MQYELKEVKLLGKPGDKEFKEIQNGQPVTVTKYGINIVIVTKIVGQPYSGFCNNDMTFFELDKSKTIDQEQVRMNAFAAQYIANKYPNT
jgi:hypothetical protein